MIKEETVWDMKVERQGVIQMSTQQPDKLTDCLKLLLGGGTLLVTFKKSWYNNFFGWITPSNEVQYHLFGHRPKTDRLPQP